MDVGGDVPFKLSLTGYGGHLGVVKLPPVCRDSPSSNLPDLVLVRGIPSYFTHVVLRIKLDEYCVVAV